MGCVGVVTARGLVAGSARLDGGVLGGSVTVDLGKGRDGGREGNGGNGDELHFDGGGWLVGWVGGLSECGSECDCLSG